MRPFHEEYSLRTALSAPHGPLSRKRAPIGIGESRVTASTKALARGSVFTSRSTRPMSTSIRFPRAAAVNQSWPRGGKTSRSAIVSASGESAGFGGSAGATVVVWVSSWATVSAAGAVGVLCRSRHDATTAAPRSATTVRRSFPACDIEKG